MLKEGGIHEYSIFLDEDSFSLFAFQIPELRHTTCQLTHHLVEQMWWKYMVDIMDTIPDFSPVSLPLTEMFYLGSSPYIGDKTNYFNIQKMSAKRRIKW